MEENKVIEVNSVEELKQILQDMVQEGTVLTVTLEVQNDEK